MEAEHLDAQDSAGNTIQVRPWLSLKEHQRKERIDQLASDIMAEEALKIINEAYEIVFDGKRKDISTEEDIWNAILEGKAVESDPNVVDCKENAQRAVSRESNLTWWTVRKMHR